MPARYITISVDDGCPEDPRAAELLHKYSLPGTFYIPAKNPERSVMQDAQIRELARQFEVGGHTFSHLGLKPMPDTQALAEIVNGKKWLEDLVGQPVISFCYPQGKFNRRTPELVRKAGFLGGRTCLFNLHNFPSNPFLWGLSTHAGNHSKMIQVRHALLEGNYVGALNFFTIYRGATNWIAHFKNALEYVTNHGGIAHLYFHSWEIEENRQWNELESVLKNVSETATYHSFTRITNGELFRLWGQLNAGVATESKSAPKAGSGVELSN